MSHITLEEYIAELPQSLTRDEKIARANEWKKTHAPKSEVVDKVDVEKVEVEEVKTQGAGANQDANQTPTPDASEKLTFYDGTLESEEDDDTPLNPSIFSDYLNVPLPNIDLNFEKSKLKDYSPKYKFDKPYNVFEYDHDFNDLHKKLFGVDIKDTFVKFDEPEQEEKPKTEAESDAEFFGVGTSVFEGAEEVVVGRPAEGLEKPIVGDDQQDKDPVDKFGVKKSQIDRLVREYIEAEDLQKSQRDALNAKIFNNENLFTPIAVSYTHLTLPTKRIV